MGTAAHKPLVKQNLRYTRGYRSQSLDASIHRRLSTFEEALPSCSSMVFGCEMSYMTMCGCSSIPSLNSSYDKVSITVKSIWMLIFVTFFSHIIQFCRKFQFPLMIYFPLVENVRRMWLQNLHMSLWLVLLQWHHNGCNGGPNHRCLDCWFSHLFRRKSKKTSKLRITDLCRGIHWWPVDSPHKGSVMWKMFPFDDVIM